MSALAEYVMRHTDERVCKCVICSDPTTRIYKEDREHTIDMMFFDVSLTGTPDVDTFKQLISEHKGVYNNVTLFDDQEHGYIELGGWIGDQGVALRFMALGEFLQLWKIATPINILGLDRDDPVAQQLAGSGLVTVLPGTYEAQQEMLSKAEAKRAPMLAEIAEDPQADERPSTDDDAS